MGSMPKPVQSSLFSPICVVDLLNEERNNLEIILVHISVEVNEDSYVNKEKGASIAYSSVQKPEIAGSQQLKPEIISLTPEKTNESLQIKPKHKVAELPDKKFTHRHLAQIKYILPEAVQAEKILIHEEKTLCMKPEMKITLLFDVVEGHSEQSMYVALQKVFASRLFSFINTHPKGCEVPEADLPDPFNQRSITTSTSLLPLESQTEYLANAVQAEPLNSSHLYPSFTRHFSKTAVASEPENTKPFESQVSLSSIEKDSMIYQDTESKQHKTAFESFSEPTMITNPLWLTCTPHYGGSSTCDSTPVKVASEVDNIMVETPAELTPKRSVPSCDEKLKTVVSQKWTPRSISTKRSLNFSYLEGEESFLDLTADEIGQNKVVNHIISRIGETNAAAPLLEAEEVRFCKEKNQMIDRSGSVLDQHISSCLSNLVTTISQIFQSANCSSITKEELVHKIIMNDCDIVERREVEVQLEHLEKLVPDWISRNLVSGGDLMYKCVYHSLLVMEC
ncbi:hypothetical protein RJ640_023570, partial [Escallonia rubra]